MKLIYPNTLFLFDFNKTKNLISSFPSYPVRIFFDLLNEFILVL